MKEIHHSPFAPVIVKLSFCLSFLLVFVSFVRAQSLIAADSDAAPGRIARARALAAIGNLTAARGELESVLHNSSVDDSLHEVALVLAVKVYVEESDYKAAEALLDEAFKAHRARTEAGAHDYFTLAGQAINSVRAHLERYSTFSLNIADADLPPEARSELEQQRALLEHIVTQGKSLRDGNAKSVDAVALLEDAAGVRLRLARDEGERAQWQREITDARQRLMSVETWVAKNIPTAAVSAAPHQSRAETTNAFVPSTLKTASTSAAAVADQRSATGESPSASTARTASPAPSTPSQSNSPTNDSANNKGAERAPFEVGSLISKATQTVAPSYPQTAKAARVSGQVTVFLSLDEKGAVVAVERAEGPELLRRAAEDAARRWKFRPTIVNGQPVRVSGFISFNFAL